MRLGKLPRVGHWEVGVVTVAGLPGEGEARFLLVVDVNGGVVRYASHAGTDVGQAVLDAAAAPLVGRPARPSTLRCPAALEAGLEAPAKALGAALRVTDRQPAIDEVARGMRDQLEEAVRARGAAVEASARASAALEGLLVPASHTSIVTRFPRDGVDRPALVLNLARPDAERLVGELRDVDVLGFEAGPGDTTLVVAWAGGVRRGVLTRMRGGATDALRGAGSLIVAADAPPRPPLREQDVVAAVPVAFTREGDALAKPAPRSSKDPSRWDGPPETWPKASVVLLEFLEPLGAQRQSVPRFERAVRMAAAIWTAVVLADVRGDPRALEDVRRLFGSDANGARVVEALVARKRSHFAKDTRVLDVREVTPISEGRVDVNVAWSMP